VLARRRMIELIRIVVREELAAYQLNGERNGTAQYRT
jgi:hypothetical protein